jgi:hypothetical protein
MLTVFGFHTDDKLYTKHADILKCSANKFGIDVHFQSFSKDDWQKIIAFKPCYIAKVRHELQGPILYIDADAIILEDIRPYFESITEDIAVHYIHNNRLISATLFINDTPNARLLVDEWEKDSWLSLAVGIRLYCRNYWMHGSKKNALHSKSYRPSITLFLTHHVKHTVIQLNRLSSNYRRVETCVGCKNISVETRSTVGLCAQPH